MLQRDYHNLAISSKYCEKINRVELLIIIDHKNSNANFC